MKVSILESKDHNEWDEFVRKSPDSNCYQLSGWKEVIEKVYGPKTYYLVAREKGIRGILPLVHLKNVIFGNNLISIPYFDYAGPLGESLHAEKALLFRAVEIAKKIGADSLEVRRNNPWNGEESALPHWAGDWSAQSRSHKVLMLLQLPDKGETLMASFKSKLRSQIKRPLKEGLYSKTGGLDLLEDFYKVFTINMRDLGSPVHSKELFKRVLATFPGKARIIMVYKGRQPVAGGFVVGFKGVLNNPWASSLREYSRMSPNMLLYWSMMEYGCNNRYTTFNFGRSSPDEGTYRFKKQWGAKPHPLSWSYISPGKMSFDEKGSEKSKFNKAIEYWKRLPVPMTRIVGPLIRKNIGL